MKLRIEERSWKQLCEELLARTDVESAGLLCGEPVQTSAGTIIVVRETMVLADDAYRIRRPDQISLDPIALNRLTRSARDRGWSVFTIHTHPGASAPWFSAADDAGDARLMPSMICQIPDAPHGSIVLIEDRSALARVFDDNAVSKPIKMQVVGRTLTAVEPSRAEDEPWFARQELALGAAGQALLRELRVGVVGLGGIGSLVSMQLAHLGVGEIVLLDGDIVEESNLSRIVGARKEDVGRTAKVDVAARYAESLGLARRIERHPEFVGSTHDSLLASCDVVVSCVDRQTPRAMLNRLAYRYLVPVIDLGTVFRVDAMGTIVGDAGRVVVVGPGRPCLGCWGHIDPHALRIEALSAEDRESQTQEGYIEGAVEAQPSVIAFNTAVAGAGVTELLRLATGFAGVESPPLRLAFSFAEGTVRRNTLAARQRCEICGRTVVGAVKAAGTEGMLSEPQG
ncbi:MAG: ThiF family adenylyltransferase [Polyangia bacterium]|jgi:molybdopterin/thiamine biosynthesis adenylyltransferase